MRTEKKIAIIIAALMVVGGLLTAAVFFQIAPNSIRGIFEAEETDKKTQTIIDSFEDIDVTILDQDITIKKTEESNAYIVYYESDKTKYDVSVSGGTLKIEEIKSKTFKNMDFVFGFGYPVELYLPKEEYNNIKVELESGNVSLTNVIAKQDFIVQTDCGDIKLKSCDGQNMELKTNDGSVTGSLKTAKSFDAKAPSGDVNVPANGNGGNCIIYTESGDIDIKIEN